MKLYEVALEMHHTTCMLVESQMADNMLRDRQNETPSRALMEVEHLFIDRAYVLGLMIDAMPAELADMEI